MRGTSLVLLALACLHGPLRAQDAPPAQQGPTGGLTREQMWFAPTAEDWKRPCLLTFQRTWEDALAVSRETQRPILVCVNMDGEIASEHYAGVRYRQSEIAALYQPYVCVIASVYRHNPRDYDEEGRRILCPRFGSVTCGEHIAIEPILFEKFMDGQRVAPRHIAVDLDGNEMYDVYYAWDTDSVFEKVREGMAGRDASPLPIVRGDRPVLERIGSRDVRDRVAVEEAYRKGDEGLRRAMLAAAEGQAGAAPTDLLRLGIFGYDIELGGLARKALAATSSADAVGLIGDALRVPMQTEERDALLGALERVGDASPRARALVTVHRGLEASSRVVDVGRWGEALAEAAAYRAAEQAPDPSERFDERARAAERAPADAGARLDLAQSSLALAQDPGTERRFARVLYEDAERAAREAQAAGLDDWRVHAVLAVTAREGGRWREAQDQAEQAMLGLPPDATDPVAASVLYLFARGRQRAIAAAVREKRDWPQQWLTDVNAAYEVLARHPLGTDEQVADHYDFVKWFGAGSKAGQILDGGLARYPGSPLLHERLRTRILEEKGVDGLESTYAALLARPDALPSMEWFAGYASLVAAEFHRRKGEVEAAERSYAQGIEHYERFVAKSPDAREGADHYVALALAGRARLALEAGDWARSLDQLLASFERRPQAAGTLDGLNLSPADTARMLRAQLGEKGETAALARLDAALSTLDPALLELPAYERNVPPREGGRGRPPRGEGSSSGQ